MCFLFIFSHRELKQETNTFCLGGVLYDQLMGTNCAPLLADLFLQFYKAEFIQNILKSDDKKLAKRFDLTFRYIDDVLSLNNSKFSDSIDLIYPNELDIKATTDSMNSAYLDNLNKTIRVNSTHGCMTNVMILI